MIIQVPNFASHVKERDNRGLVWGLEICHSCGKPCFADDAHSLAGQAYVMIYRIIALRRVKLVLVLDGSFLKGS